MICMVRNGTIIFTNKRLTTDNGVELSTMSITIDIWYTTPHDTNSNAKQAQ